jgi:hypothetical protein
MSNFEVGTFLFRANELTKTINLNNVYENDIVVKLTPQNSSINLFLVNMYNNDRFTVAKNANENVTVNYIVIESNNSQSGSGEKSNGE